MINKLYKEITPQEKKQEIRLLKKEIAKLEKQMKPLKEAIKYLNTAKNMETKRDKIKKLLNDYWNGGEVKNEEVESIGYHKEKVERFVKMIIDLDKEYFG